MANTKSAKKMVRKIARRTERNRDQRSRMRTFIRRVEEAIASGDKGQSRTGLARRAASIRARRSKRSDAQTPGIAQNFAPC